MRTFLIMSVMTFFLVSRGQSFEIETIKRDTINLTDVQNKKQGKWLIRGIHKPGSCYTSNQKIEEGLYKDNKKIGVWVQYYCNANIKNKITFVDGKPNGPTTMYYENGGLKEEGTWINNRWVGKYKSISENGDVSEIVFDDKGKEVSKKITPSKKSVPSKKK